MVIGLRMNLIEKNIRTLLFFYWVNIHKITRDREDSFDYTVIDLYRYKNRKVDWLKTDD